MNPLYAEHSPTASIDRAVLNSATWGKFRVLEEQRSNYCNSLISPNQVLQKLSVEANDVRNHPSPYTTHTYGNAAHQHAVTSLSTGESYSYDANGNMIQRVEGGLTYTQTFDAESRLISVTVSGQTTQFVYDGDGNLIKQIKPDGSRILYVAGGMYEITKNAGGTPTGTVLYYPAGGAMRVNGTLFFVLKDHLGSASVVTDINGTTLGEDRFGPFGQTRFTSGTMYTDKLYTGQRQIAGLGIYHYGARFYSPYINRFLSADTIVPGYANPQNLNRYSYVANNPLRYIDPTGHIYLDNECGYQGQDCGDSIFNSGSSRGGSNGDGGGGNNNDDDDEPPGHEYETENVVCPAIFDCTEAEMQEYATMFQYPGQLPWNPVQSGYTYFVFPAPLLASYFGNPLLLLSGAIQVRITGSGLTVTNQTQPTHIFHTGQVVRHYEQDADGAWTVTSTGTGTNVWPGGSDIDQANDVVGPLTFNAVDTMMETYIVLDQLPDLVIEQTSRLLP